MIPYRLALVLLMVVLAAPGCQNRRSPRPVPHELRPALTAYIAERSHYPPRYVANLFDRYDVVFLGEVHYLEHDPRFVRRVLTWVYDKGVHVLATEFARREDQARIDSLLALPAWDEGLARAIQFDQSVAWGYREYVDILLGAWELNHALADSLPRLRVLGLNDSPDWSQLETDAQRDDPAVMARVWRGGGEQLWARVILDAVASGEKVLVYSGIHHAFTRYRQPVVVDGKFVRFDDSRMGNHVYRAIGERAFTVFLHAPWHGRGGYDDDYVHPAQGVIDMYMFTRPEGPLQLGFDIVGSPLAEVRPRDCVYQHGYEDFKLADFCDGWVYTAPISHYGGVEPIPGWIHEGNIAQARRQSASPRAREYSVEEFNAMIARTADAKRYCGKLR